MLSTDYYKATSDFPHQLPPPGYWGALQQVRLAGQWIYRAVVSAKCKRCRKASNRAGGTFAPCSVNVANSNCPICGNPSFYTHRRRRIETANGWRPVGNYGGGGNTFHWETIKAH